MSFTSFMTSEVISSLSFIYKWASDHAVFNYSVVKIMRVGLESTSYLVELYPDVLSSEC